jgi:hypothetical protein
MKEKKHILFVLNLLTLQCVYFPSILAQRGGKKGLSWNLGIVRRKWICIFFVLFELPAIIFLCEIQIWNLAILNIIPENSIPRYLHLWWACYYWDEEILFSNMLKIEIFIAELSLSLIYIYRRPLSVIWSLCNVRGILWHRAVCRWLLVRTK